MPLKGNWVYDQLDRLPAEVVIGLAAIRFLSTAPAPRFIHVRRAAVLDWLGIVAKRAFFAVCPTVLMLFVWLLILFNHYVLTALPGQHLAVPPLARAAGYGLLAVQIASYARTLRTHPGSPPAEWRSAAACGRAEHFVCRRTGRLLPPRAYHLRATGEDILFLDHFCAWLDQPIGLHNRKYFLLFLSWSTLLCAFGVAACSALLFRLCYEPAAAAWLVLPFLPLGSALGGMPVPLPAAATNSTLSQQSVASFRLSFCCATGALLFNIVALLFLGGFAISSLFMAANGRVALCPLDATYDVGVWRNLKQIFGAPVGWRWALPLAPAALATDGLSFPRNKRCDDETQPLVSQPDVDI